MLFNCIPQSFSRQREYDLLDEKPGYDHRVKSFAGKPFIRKILSSCCLAYRRTFRDLVPDRPSSRGCIVVTTAITVTEECVPSILAVSTYTRSVNDVDVVTLDFENDGCRDLNDENHDNEALSPPATPNTASDQASNIPFNYVLSSVDLDKALRSIETDGVEDQMKGRGSIRAG